MLTEQQATELVAENLHLYRVKAELTLENTHLGASVRNLQSLVRTAQAERQALAQQLCEATHAD